MKKKLVLLVTLNVLVLIGVQQYYLFESHATLPPLPHLSTTANATKCPAKPMKNNSSNSTLPKQESVTPYFFDYFANIWTEKSINDQIRLFSAVDAVFTGEKLEYYLWGGSMLAVVRNNTISPWDDDSDIAVDIADYTKIRQLEPIFAKFGIQFHNHTTIGIKLSLKNNPSINTKFPWSWPFVDIWRWERKISEKGTPLLVQEFPRRAFAPSDVTPAKRAWNEGLLLSIPGNYTRWISKYFGSDVRKICQPGFWNHRTETSFPKEIFSTIVNCSSLEPLHPFRKENFTDFTSEVPLIPKKYHQIKEAEPGIYQISTSNEPICYNSSNTPMSVVIDKLISQGGIFHHCQTPLFIPPNVTMFIRGEKGHVKALASTKAHPLLYLLQEKISKLEALPIVVSKLMKVFAGFEKYFIIEEL